jgi:hypothetical protein
VVEGSGLENRQGRKSFVSSNLTHAAGTNILSMLKATPWWLVPQATAHDVQD